MIIRLQDCIKGKPMIIFLFFPESRLLHIMQIVSNRDSLHGLSKKGKSKVQGVPQSQTAALPRPQEEEETDKSKQAQIKQTYEKH